MPATPAIMVITANFVIDFITLQAVQRFTKRLVRGLVNFVSAIAYLFCLNLPAAFSQPGNGIIEIPFRTTSDFQPFPTLPVFPINGSAVKKGDVSPRRVRRTEVAENWQLVCANNAARLPPPQRLVGDEQKIAACLERCSQKLIQPDGKNRISLYSTGWRICSRTWVGLIFWNAPTSRMGSR